METEMNIQGDAVSSVPPQAADFLGTEMLSTDGGDLAGTMDALASRLILDDDEEHLEAEENLDGSGRETIGTFFVNDTEFALAASSVREVVPFPSQVTQVPLTPDAFHGIFSLRGEVLPLLDAATLLAADSQVDMEQRRVAIVGVAEGHVGIAFDRTGEVLRIDPKHRFGLCDSDGQSNGVINGIIQLDGGDRCIQELSATLIGSVPDVPYSKNPTFGARGQVDPTVYQKVISVRVGDYELAFPMDNLVEIQSALEMQAAPAYYEHCKGVLHLRGRIHTVMDFRAALGLEPAEGQCMFVFIQHAGLTIALEVDSLVETIEYAEDAPMDMPKLPSTGVADACRSLLPLAPDRQVLMVDVGRIFERYAIAEGISVLAPLNTTKQEEVQAGVDEDQRAVFSFQLAGRSLSLEMEDVLEVRRYPEEVIESTGSDSAVVGIMNLRGSVTPLIDLRARFGLPPWEPSGEVREESPVVIVVEGTDSPYGLVVDKIDRIHRFFPSHARMVPTLLNQQSLGEGLLGYIKAALMLDGLR